MKKFAAVFAATALVGVTTAFAANPFSDVTPDSWAYQAVSQLANAGIVNGYPDGTFKGQNNITRYEMAQMVAKAMANQDRANAEQQAMINRLADEFSNELNNLGVRVSNLEDRVGNIKATGDVRLRYRGSEDSETNGKAYGLTNKNSKFDFRGRVQFNANVNENTKAVLRVTSGDVEFGDATGGTTSSKAIFDRVYVQHNFGKRVTATAGRYQQTIGAGLFYDNTFDGANIKVGNDKIAVEGAYGYLSSDSIKDNAESNPEVAYAALTGKVGHYTRLGGFYMDLKKGLNIGGGTNAKLEGKYYGFNADVNYKKTWVGGEWLKNKDVDNSTLWIAGVGYGNFNVSKANSWDVKVQHFDLDKNGYIPDSKFAALGYKNDAKGFLATVDYALAKNVGLSGYYGFSVEDQNGNDKNDFYRAELNYKF